MKLIAIAALLAGCAFAQDGPYMIVQTVDASLCAALPAYTECHPHVLAMVMRLPAAVDSVRFTMTYTDVQGQSHQDTQTNRASSGVAAYGMFISDIKIVRVDAIPLAAAGALEYAAQP